MNCISAATLPKEFARIRRVIEYFYPGKDQGKIWVDIFIDNPSDRDLRLRVLHAGSLAADDVTADAWVREKSEIDDCSPTLTQRIIALHAEGGFPITVNRKEQTVTLSAAHRPAIHQADQNIVPSEMIYHTWNGNVRVLVGDNPGAHVPFTLWEIDSIARRTGTVIRLRLSMHEETYNRRFAKTEPISFRAYGEALVLQDIETGMSSYTGPAAEEYTRTFADFKNAYTGAPEAFEYLIVSPTKLDWKAEPINALIAENHIRSDKLAETTAWFTTAAPHTDAWELRAQFALRVAKAA